MLSSFVSHEKNIITHFFLFIMVILFFQTASYGQKIATTFRDAVEKGISIEELDATYKSALHEDSAKAAFNGREDEFYKGYISLLKDLNGFLKQRDFSWGKTTNCFNRIYFDKDGGIDYFLFNFKPGDLQEKKETEFQSHLQEFIETYKFPLTNDVNFAQCSPVKYVD